MPVERLLHAAKHERGDVVLGALEQPEREYRSKLVELTRAENTLFGLLRAFTKQSGNDRSSPHAFANLHVVRDTSKALFGDDSATRNPLLWATKNRKEIHQAAENLLRANTRTLQARGADTVTRCLLPD